jgi:nickel-dependent lactate racemase
MSNRLELPWGGRSLTLDLPRTWRIMGILSPPSATPPADPAEACRLALASPVGAQPLRELELVGKRVAVVTEDHTRPTGVATFLPVVLDELAAAGASDQAVDILLANGVHRASTLREVKTKLGPAIAERYRWRCHDAYDQAQLVSLGTTARGTHVQVNALLLEVDLIICVGAIEPHLLLGHGGGLKMLVPGCAGAGTIGKNHLQGVDPDHFDLVGVAPERSPMRLDLEQAAQLIGRPVFIVNAAMSHEGAPLRFFCGEPIAAHRAGVEFVDRRARLDVPQQADVVLANSHPMDADLRQSIKCVGNSLFAAKAGGLLLGCVRCENGLGEMPVPRHTLPYPLLRTLVKLVGKRRILPLVERLKRGEPVEEVFISHFGLQMLRRNQLGLYSDILPASTGSKIGLARTFDSPRRFVRWAVTRTSPRATVWVFPHGGATYAAPPPA